MASTFLIAALLLAVAIGTYVWQLAARQSQRAEEHAPFEADFYQQRHRRRTQVSLLLAVVAVAMVVGILIVDPLLMSLFWLGVLLLLLWIVLLAMFDASASHTFFERLRSRELAQQAALHANLRGKHGSDT